MVNKIKEAMKEMKNICKTTDNCSTCKIYKECRAVRSSPLPTDWEIK